MGWLRSLGVGSGVGGIWGLWGGRGWAVKRAGAGIPKDRAAVEGQVPRRQALDGDLGAGRLTGCSWD